MTIHRTSRSQQRSERPQNGMARTDSMAAATCSVTTGVALALGGVALLATANRALLLTAVLLVVAVPVSALGAIYILRQKDIDRGVRAAFFTLSLAVAIVSVLTLLIAT